MIISFYKTNLLKIIIIILLLVILCACKAIKSEIKKVNTYKVSKDMDNNYKAYVGTVSSQNNPILSFQVQGQITYFPYSKGDFIKKGNAIARIDSALYEIEKKQIQAQLKEANINYTKSKKYYSRMDMLHRAGGISDNDWEEAYYSLQTNRQNIDVQRQRLNYLNKQISYTTIYAPFDGYIKEKFKENGSFANASEPVLSFIGNNKTLVEIMVEDNVVNSLKIGQIVDVKQKDKSFVGRITNISKSSERSGGYLVKILLNNLENNLLEGMNVDVKLPNKSYSSSIFIPLNCVFEKDNENYVYKIIEIQNNYGKIKQQRIETNEIKNNEIEITKGLNSGDIIVRSGLSGIKEGMKVSL